MSTLNAIIVKAVTLFVVLAARAQQPFQDLNFEAAMPSTPITGPIPGANYQPVGLALPGWTASIGNVPVTEVLQNASTLGAASVDLFGPNYTAVGQGGQAGEGIINGNYTVYLQSGGANGGVANVSLAQMGTIPVTAQSLVFSAWTPEIATDIFSVSFNGNSLSPVVLSSLPNPSGIPVNIYGVNIAAFAGQTGQLQFTSVFNPNGTSWTEFDDITFSPTAVPEPNTLALLVMGGLAVATRHLRRKR